MIPTLVVDPDLRPALLSDLVEARGEVEEATGPEQRANSEARGAFDEQLTVTRDSIVFTLSPVLPELSLSVSQNWKH